MPARVPIHDEAVCVRHWDWSETSQTVTLLTRKHGLVRALAKGSKRPKSPYSGGVELLTRAECGLILKPTSELGLLTEWNLLEVYPVLRSNLIAHRTGLYLAELIQHMVSDRDPHEALYELLVSSLRALVDTSEPSRQRILLRFQRTMLVIAGYQPVLDRDVRSQRLMTDERIAHFAPELGGILLSETHENGVNERIERWPVRASTLRAISGETGLGDDDVIRANMFLATYIRYLIGRSPFTLVLAIPQMEGKL